MTDQEQKSPDEKRGFELEKTGKGEMTRHETAASAQAEGAKALIQAKFIMAMNRPRNMDDVRVKLLQTCRRPRFAKEARYAKPQGAGKVFGPSIRFADEAARLMGNVDVQKHTIYEDHEKRILLITSLDLETNTSKTEEVTIIKTVERKSKKNREVLAERTNTRGETVFVVVATDDELFSKENNICAKIRRNVELQLLPQDIIEECMDVCTVIQRDETAKDPDAAKKGIIDNFAEIGINPADIVLYLKHPLDRVSPAELDELRTMFAAIRDGTMTWADYFADEGGTGRASKLTPGQHDRSTAPAPEATAEPAAATPEPGTKKRPGPKLSEKNKTAVMGAFDASGVDDDAFLLHLKESYGIGSIEDLKIAEAKEVVRWLKARGETVPAEDPLEETGPTGAVSGDELSLLEE